MAYLRRDGLGVRLIWPVFQGYSPMRQCGQIYKRTLCWINTHCLGPSPVSTRVSRMQLAYSYIRFSSKKQEQNDSVRRQVRLRDDWLRANPGVTLDTQVSLRDLGVSAFRGANLNPDFGDLGKFIALVEQSNSPIPPGSYLLLERLDRFSRQKVSAAYTALTRLVQNGIRVVVLDPTPHEINKENIDHLQIVLPIITNLCLAHEQSREKSKRVGHAWKSRREDARNKGTIYTRRTPAWIKYDESTGALVLDEEKAKPIRYLFKRTVEGAGQVTLVRELNEKYKPITGSTGSGRPVQWNTSYLSKILNDRSVIGEFQPHYLEDGKQRIKDGEPIKGYFPSVVSEEIFYQAQYQKSLRKKERSEQRTQFVNLFTGLVFSDADGSPMQIQTSRTRRQTGDVYVQRRLWSYSSRKGIAGSCPWSIEYQLFEDAILSSLTELNPKNFSGTFAATEERSAIYQQIEGCASKIRELEDAVEDVSSKQTIASAMKMIDNLNRQKEQFEARLQSLAGVNDTAFSDAIEGIASITEEIKNQSYPHNHSIRCKLKGVIPTIVEKIIVAIRKRGNRQTIAVALVMLRDGTERTVTIRKVAAMEGLGRVLFYDKNKLPIVMLTQFGSVHWSEFHRIDAESIHSMTPQDIESLSELRSDPHWVLVNGRLERFSESRIPLGVSETSAEVFLRASLHEQIDDIADTQGFTPPSQRT